MNCKSILRHAFSAVAAVGALSMMGEPGGAATPSPQAKGSVTAIDIALEPVGTVEYLDKMLAEPFDEFTFSPAGASVYQLGNYGTARKALKVLELTA